jgi:hypothetical protein
MLYYQRGSAHDSLSSKDLEEGLKIAFDKLGHKKRVFAIPPDFTRFHSFAGEITQLSYKYYQDRMVDVMPALGTHTAMTDAQIDTMFAGVPKDLFRVHDWRNDVVTIGEVPSEYIHEITEGRIDYSWPAQVNRLLL